MREEKHVRREVRIKNDFQEIKQRERSTRQRIAVKGTRGALKISPHSPELPSSALLFHLLLYFLLEKLFQVFQNGCDSVIALLQLVAELMK